MKERSRFVTLFESAERLALEGISQSLWRSVVIWPALVPLKMCGESLPEIRGPRQKMLFCWAKQLASGSGRAISSHHGDLQPLTGSFDHICHFTRVQRLPLRKSNTADPWVQIRFIRLMQIGWAIVTTSARICVSGHNLDRMLS